MLWAAIDQLPLTQKVIAQGAIDVAAVCIFGVVVLRLWRVIRGDR